DWLRDLENRLRELEEHVRSFRFDKLGENQEFVSVTLQATKAAIKTHQTEKVTAFRNAVLNVAAGKAPVVEKQAIFLQCVNRFESLHLKLLSFMEAPMKFGALWVSHQTG